MDGERKIIDGIFPITTTKAVYIDGTHAIGGSPEGVTIYKGQIIWAHANPGSFYRFDANI